MEDKDQEMDSIPHTDTPTIIDTDATPSRDTHLDGWLTHDSYVEWVACRAGVRLDERPFSQPPSYIPTPEEDEEAAAA